MNAEAFSLPMVRANHRQSNLWAPGTSFLIREQLDRSPYETRFFHPSSNVRAHRYPLHHKTNDGLIPPAVEISYEKGSQAYIELSSYRSCFPEIHWQAFIIEPL